MEKGKQSVFEKMVAAMSQREEDERIGLYMGKSLGGNNSPKGSMTRRYEVLACAFRDRLGVKEVNELLLKNGCDILYARNRTEASLLFAFSKNLTYEEWRDIYKRMMQSELASAENYGEKPASSSGTTGEDVFGFTGNRISCNDLLEYLLRESSQEAPGQTLHRTRFLREQIEDLPRDEKRFFEFLEMNDALFSAVREKSRYYFCKYLYAYMMTQINSSCRLLEKGSDMKSALSTLVGVKGATALKRGKVSRGDAEKHLMESPLSYKEIYDEMNYFYFEYVSNDWMEILLEYYEDLSSLNEEDAAYLADALRAYRKEWKDFSNQEVLKAMQREIKEKDRQLDEEGSSSGAAKGYQKNRSGEKSIRNYLFGKKDIDRTSLICYLIFFNRNAHYELFRSAAAKSRNLLIKPINLFRLNAILKECGFPELREEDDFDHFVIEYLISDDPEEYLMNTVSMVALDYENFYLYHMYNGSVNNEEVSHKWLW